MKLKHKNYDSTTLNRFDLLGDNEVGLAKSFAYLISCERNILYSFLRNIGIAARNTESNYRETTIEIERHRDEGRTDIEIRQKNKFHVIVECKVGKNWIGRQRTQYLSAFDNSSKEKKALCFITQREDCHLDKKDKNIAIYYREWSDILDLISDKEFDRSELVKEFDRSELVKEFDRSELVKEFVGYVTKGFNMRTRKEILIQDVSAGSGGINRFEKYRIYRRGKVRSLSPLYFAPYYTKRSKHPNGAGISYLSKVLGVLLIKPKDVVSYIDDLKKFAENDEDIVKRWREGLENSDKPDAQMPYYFLDEPVKLINPLEKAKRGEAKNWISDQIPPNLCVTFEEFTRRIIAGG